MHHHYHHHHHQGAGSAFDTNMDFSNMFATPQQHAYTPADNTAGIFFADEGIDTSASSSFLDPAVFANAPQQSTFDMQHSLTLDDTSATTAWDTQLTSEMQLQHTAKPFPPTPLQSFDAMPSQSNAPGKRPLQLEMHDYPNSKRQASFDFPLFPTPPTTTTSSWGLEQLPSTLVDGLPDEAADVCATWFNKYNVLPSDRHIDSLSQLTGEPADAIRSWFSQLLKQGMGGSHSDSAYKSQTALIQQEQQQQRQEPFWNDHTFQTDIPGAYNTYESVVQQTLGETSTPASSPNRDNTAVTVPVISTRGSKKRCTPTEDIELLGRDVRKIYQCTRRCGKRYGRKNDWKRNEEEGYPCKSWVCSLCTVEGVENVKPCYRKYHFVQHFRNIHPEMNAEDFDKASIVYSETEFPRRCGFCRHRFQSRQERIDHIADHFKQGKCMLDWRDEEDKDGHDSADDDNDDGPSDDGFGGKSSPQPPFDPRGDSGSKHSGTGGSSDGSAGQSSSGGFFQFQLSQLGESHCCCADQHTRPIIPSPNISQSSTSAETDASLTLSDSADQQALQDIIVPAEGGYKNAPVGDVLAPHVKRGFLTSFIGDRSDNRLLVHSHWNYSRAGRAADAGSYISPSLVSLMKVHTMISTQNSTAMGTTRTGLQPPKTSFISVKLLGSGGFSTVDEVVHQQTGLHVGRKTLKNRSQTAIEELKKEVSVLQKLRHPHIIRLIGTYARGDKMSILLSPVAQTTLTSWLERSVLQKPANLSETIVKMFGCLASSVRYLHEQRPVVKHMDIKPQNILIVEGDQEFPHVVLSDFGVSSTEELSDGQCKPLTRQYIAPEVFEGFARKQAADIWSLGCVFAEMASVPFSQDNTAWLAFRKAFSGRTGKHYWQDVAGLQDKLAAFLAEAKTKTEQTVVRTLQSMLNADPDERPDAGSLTMIFTPAPCCLNWPNDKATFPSPQDELVGVEKLTSQGDINTCDHSHTHGRKVTGSDASLSNAKAWLDECSHMHDACWLPAPREGSNLPTRLIEVLPDGQGGIRARVIETDGIGSTPHEVNYVALSHVWSHMQPLLSSDTLLSMQTELLLPTLPIAVANAIVVVHKLGYRYCWLDSLCVLQDLVEDRESECRSMASIFRNAALTVVLDQLGGDNVEGGVGVLNTADETDQTSLLGSTANKRLNSGRLPAFALLPADLLTAPNLGWDTRAWALQDRLLSRRFLHLGEQLYWECNALKASETFPRGLPALVWEKVHTVSGKDVQPVLATATNGNSKGSNEAQVVLDNCPVSISVSTTGKTCYDKDHLDTRETRTSDAKIIRLSDEFEPQHPHLAAASHLCDCQWVRKQGDDTRREEMGAVRATPQFNKAQEPHLDSTCQFSHSRSCNRHLNGVCIQAKTLPGQNPGGGHNGSEEGMENGDTID